MRCSWCRKNAKYVVASGLCKRCEGRSVRPDRFWLIMVVVPMLLLAGLGTVLVLAAVVR
jgi:hypothetical protein